MSVALFHVYLLFSFMMLWCRVTDSFRSAWNNRNFSDNTMLPCYVYTLSLYSHVLVQMYQTEVAQKSQVHFKLNSHHTTSVHPSNIFCTISPAVSQLRFPASSPSIYFLQFCFLFDFSQGLALLYHAVVNYQDRWFMKKLFSTESVHLRWVFVVLTHFFQRIVVCDSSFFLPLQLIMK